MINDPAIYMTVEHHGDKGMKIISNEYPRTLSKCSEAVDALHSTFPDRKYGIVKLVQLKSVQRPAIVTDWIEPK